MASVLWGVPYEITTVASDLKSGKPVTNRFFYRADGSSGPEPAYGTPVNGDGDTQDVLTSFVTAFEELLAILSVNYQVREYVLRSIVGKRYATPSHSVAGLINSLTIIIQTAAPHGLVTGSTVYIYGVANPVSANGLWVVTVLDSTKFSLNGSVPGTGWSGDGYWQLPSGTVELQYGDRDVFEFTSLGAITGDALPLFVSASIRRINAGVGRHWRSRISLSPMGESQAAQGAWTVAGKAAIDAALTAFLDSDVVNGSTDPGQAVMSPSVISPSLALGLATPFTSSFTWCKVCSGLICQPNPGSITRRKPRLTASIDPA